MKKNFLNFKKSSKSFFKTMLERAIPKDVTLIGAMGVKFFGVMLIGVMLGGCATCNRMEGPVKKVMIEQFDNKTVQYDLNIKLTDMVTEELLRESGVELVQAKDAEYKLTGSVQKYELNPIAYTEDNSVESYELIIHVQISLIKLADSTVIYEESDLIGDTMYLTVEGDPNAMGSNLDLEREAQERVLDYLARDIARKVAVK